jgi:glycosyltransferase involved in cell wall biosynthesis
VAPLALEPAHYMPPAELSSELVGLIGWAYWAPTKLAVERLLRSVWPAVLARRPDARLVLAGKDMVHSQFAHVREPPGVEWRGLVPSATEFLRELGVMLYPLTRGSGTKIKVLEAMALGMPVVTTPEGAEGVAANGGVTVETEDARLVEATLALLESRGERSAAGTASHETFMRDHTPAVAARPVVELYERMLA